jgi:hypothetical protein
MTLLEFHFIQTGFPPATVMRVPLETVQTRGEPSTFEVVVQA